MRAPDIDAPIFLVGMGRSGSTLIFDVLAAHPRLGWFSNYSDVLGRRAPLALLSRLCDLHSGFRKAVTRSDQTPGPIDRFRIGPSEAYDTWEKLCGEKFRRDYLLGRRATPEESERTRRFVAQVLRWQGKPRFLAKITGPPRIGYLASIFPDAYFVHIVRDGRAVVNSLLRAPFWRDSFRLREPSWHGGFPDAYRERWEQLDRSPLALAALQWRNVVEIARREQSLIAEGRYHELRYEDFLADPAESLRRICRACDLPDAPRMISFLSSRFQLRDRNEGFGQTFSPADLATLEELLGDLLAGLGYVSASCPPSPSNPGDGQGPASGIE